MLWCPLSARQGPVDSPCPSDYPAESHVESENHPLPKAEDMPNDKTTLDYISSDGVKEEVLQTKEVFSKDSDFVLDGLDFSLGTSKTLLSSVLSIVTCTKICVCF